MKNFSVRRIAALVMCVAMAACACACTGTEDADEQTTMSPSTQATTSQAPSDTTSEATPTPEPTPTPTPRPTKAPLTEDQIGKAFDDTLEGVETLFEDDFSGSDDDYLQDGNAITPSSSDNVEIVDGALCYPYQDGAFAKTHLSYAPYVDTLDYDQVELTFDYKWTEVEGNDGVWFAMMIGCYVTDIVQKIPDVPGDGLWLAFSNRSAVTVYGVGAGTWPTGVASIPIGSGFEVMKTVRIITTPGALWLYFVEDGADVLQAKFEIQSDKIIITDGNGAQISELENDSETLSGGYFKFWTHMVGTTLDNVRIRAY